MAKKSKLNKSEYEALSDEAKEFYIEKDGSYLLDSDDAATLRNSLDNAKRERDEANKILKPLLAALGDAKPDEVAKLIADTRTAQEEALKTAGKWDEMKAQMRKEFEEKELAPLKSEAEKYKNSAQKVLVENEFRRSLETLNPFEGAADVLLPHFSKHARIVEENGEMVARVFDGDTLQVNSKGEPLSFTEFADTKFRQSPIFGRFFQADDTAGSGSPAFSAGAGVGGVKTVSKNDQSALSNNLEAIAAGEVTVR